MDGKFSPYACALQNVDAADDLCSSSLNVASFDTSTGILQIGHEAPVGHYDILIKDSNNAECPIHLTVTGGSDTHSDGGIDCQTLVLVFVEPMTNISHDPDYYLGQPDDLLWSTWADIVQFDGDTPAGDECGTSDIVWEQSADDGATWQPLDPAMFTSSPEDLKLTAIGADSSQIGNYKLRYQVFLVDYPTVKTDGFSTVDISWNFLDCTQGSPSCSTQSYGFESASSYQFQQSFEPTDDFCTLTKYVCTQESTTAPAQTDLCGIYNS